MKFYPFGSPEKPALLLLPGTCCHWKRNFSGVVGLLERDFYVVCASYDGFDETEQTIFPDMITETEQIERYLQNTFGGRIFAAYGCSMGGSFAGLLVQRRKVQIEHAILGSSDLDQGSGVLAKMQAGLIAAVLYGIFQKGYLPGWMQRRLEKKSPAERAYTQQMLRMFGVGSTDMAFVRKKSIRNQFYSDLATPLADAICAPGTTVHIFYAMKMGEKYEARYRRHFKDPDIRRHDMQHEALLICQPEAWAQEVRTCCEMEA